ncbi:MAG: alpha-E domain-containing protein, partial [Verrucomicrobiota bacterium]
NLSRTLVQRDDEPASILSSVTAAYFAAQQIRDFISPEVWQVLSELYQFLQEAAQRKRASRTRLRETCQRVVDDAARLTGTADRTMLHDDGWQFFRIGSFVERAQGTAIMVSEVLAWAIQDSDKGNSADEADLTALLRLLSSLDAYRREYRSRAYLDRVVHLLLQNPSNPSSVSHCLRQLRYALGTLSIMNKPDSPTELETMLTQAINHIEGLPLFQLVPSSVKQLDEGEPDQADTSPSPELKKILESVTQELDVLHERIEDTYFSHQSEFYRERQLSLNWKSSYEI